MAKITEYKSLLEDKKKIKIICTDNSVFSGRWIDWTSALDNDPDPESITIETDTGILIELYVEEIESIEAVE